MKNEIDLSKIAVKQLPTKKIKANFDGTEKEFTITALSDSEQYDFQALWNNSTDVFRNRNLNVLLLTCGLGIQQEVAALLYEYKRDEATRVANEIFTFTREFEKTKADETEKAEKNLPPPAPENTTAE
jgi:hypothetical protein